MIKAIIFDITGVLVRGNKEVTEVTSYVKQNLKAGISIFLLSNNVNISNTYEKFPFLARFPKKVYFSAQVGFVKPDPRAYEFVLNDNNLKPEECVYFDDINVNVEVAQGLGIRAYKFVGLADVKRAFLENELTA